jgi:acetolactate synthase-1/3 small subunit
MAMVKFPLKEVKNNLADIDAIARCYNGKISNVNDKHIVVSVVDRPDRIDNFLKAMQAKYRNIEIVRSGVSVIER